MPKVPVDQAPAGPALDAAVAAELGRPGYLSNYVFINGERRDMLTWIGDGFTPEDPQAGLRAGRMPPPVSTDIAAAWGLMEAKRAEIMAKDWIDFCDILKELILRNSGWRDVYALLNGLTPLAITRAYLKAKGVEEVEIA